MNDRRFINATGLVLGSDFVSKIALLILDGLIVAFLPANQIGAFLLFSFFIRFAPYSGIGAISYISKVLPQTHDKMEQRRVIQNASRLVFLLAGIYLGLALIHFFFFFFSVNGGNAGNMEFATALLAISMILFMTMQQTVSRSLFAFPIYVASQMVQAILAMGLGLLLIPDYGLNGVYAAFLTSYSGAIITWWVFSHQRLSVNFTQDFEPTNLVLPIRVGGWFFLLTIGLFLMQSLDRFAVLQLGGEQAQAMFGVGFLFYQTGIIVINSIGKVAGPMILSGRGRLDETQSSDALCLFCFAAYFIVLLTYLIFSAVASGWLPVRFQSAHDVSIWYLTSGFVTALGLALVPQIIKNNGEKILIVSVAAICIVTSGVITFIPDLFRMPQDFAVLSLLIAATFSLTSIVVPIYLKKVRLGVRSVLLRIGCVLLMSVMPAFIAIS